jgi:hypothetical protein
LGRWISLVLPGTGLRIEPVFWSAAQLSEKLIDILRAEVISLVPTFKIPAQ